MNEYSHDTVSQTRQICCPSCHTLVPFPSAEGSACAHCGLELQWIDKYPKARKALESWGSRDIELCVHAEWPGGSAQTLYSGEGPFDFIADGNMAGRFSWEDQGHQIRIEIDDRSEAFALPAEYSVGHTKYFLRSVASDLSVRELQSLQLAYPRTSAESIKNGTCLLGRRIDVDISISDNNIDPHHCLFVRLPGKKNNHWLIDLQSKTGTFVNKNPIIAHRLESGDLIQVGPYVWQFSANDSFLVPVNPIKGVTLGLHHVKVKGRLGPINLTISPGQFVAIVGGSGAGKSTLLRAIIARKHGNTGQVLVDGKDTLENPNLFRRQLGYVSQQQVIHEHLTAEQVLGYALKFREGRKIRRDKETKSRIKNCLRTVNLPEHRHRGIITNLSGGETRRVQTAAELLCEPGLFILDEPTSGLDPEREKSISQLLRGLAYRGATVIVVTHSPSLEVFDRILEVGRKDKKSAARIIFDGTPDDYEIFKKKSQYFFESPKDTESEYKNKSESRTIPRKDSSLPLRIVQRLKETRNYSQRECTLLFGDWIRRLLLPLLVVPFVFSLALHISVPGVDFNLLGFLSVLSCIWMGASLGLLSIVNERRIIEHERLMFLNVFPYMLAKTLVLFACSSIQTFIFFILLWKYRSTTEEMFQEPRMCLLWLIFVGCAGVGLGLLISAAAGLKSVTANFVLPLIMIAQIVFSVHITGNANDFVDEAYSHFSISVPQKNNRSEGQRLLQTPSWVAAASYLTISRYGDIALCRFAYSQVASNELKKNENSDDSQQVNNPSKAKDSWYWEALIGLIVFAFGLPILAGVVIKLLPRDYES